MSKPWLLKLAIVIAFIVAAGGVVVFAYRAGVEAGRMHAQNEPIREWMTIPFVAHAHHVPAESLFQAIGTEPRLPNDRRSIRQLSFDLHRPVPELISELQHAVSVDQNAGRRP
jgi:hypothetical protein